MVDDELIKFKNVKKEFGKRVVLDSINLVIPEGKVTGIVGASGEGKTTLLKLLVGYYKPTSGEIMYSKRNIKQDSENMKKMFGFATEDGSFHERLTVFENMVHFGRLYHMKKKDIVERAEQLLKFVGLDKAHDTLAFNLSMGMKKRLDVAISLLHSPEVLIMDEPTADLDPLLRDHMLELIKRINKTGTTIILTTQLLTEMDELCDKIAILYEKNIIEQGSISHVKAKYSAKDMEGVFNKIFSRKEKEIKQQEVKQEKKIERVEKVEEVKPIDQEAIDEEIKRFREEVARSEEVNEVNDEKPD